MKAIRVVLAVALLAAAGPSVAGQAMNRLQHFTDGLKTFSADFVQTVYDENKNPIRQSQGQAWLKRPGLFRWEYRKPYHQVIVADGKHLWVYDEDLKQVTVRNTKKALATAPIQLLSGEKPLASQFKMQDRGKRQGLEWVELRPKVQDSDFRRIFLGLDTHGLKVMELHDRFDQTTQIRFKDEKINPQVDSSRFQFTPPKGVDVIGKASGGNGG